MNLCVLLGEIVSEIQFEFIIKGKNKSIAYLDLLLLNKSVVRVKAFNETATKLRKLGQIHFYSNQNIIKFIKYIKT